VTGQQAVAPHTIMDDTTIDWMMKRVSNTQNARDKAKQ
jgi:hypothetical protein